MRVALDTNILVYAEGVNDSARRDAAVGLLSRLATQEILLPVQVLGELFRVLVRKQRQTPDAARAVILEWEVLYDVIPTSQDVLAAAVDLAALHQLDIWDAVVLAAAAEARCRLLLSEDLQHGFVWSGVAVANPFSVAAHPLLAAALR